MNEEELKKGCGELIEKSYLGVNICGKTSTNGIMNLCPTCQARLEGFQKGKLEQKKEDNRGKHGRKHWVGNKSYYSKKVKQLQKEIGGNSK